MVSKCFKHLLFSIVYIWVVILPIDELHHFSRWLLHHQPALVQSFISPCSPNHQELNKGQPLKGPKEPKCRVWSGTSGSRVPWFWRNFSSEWGMNIQNRHLVWSELELYQFISGVRKTTNQTTKTWFWIIPNSIYFSVIRCFHADFGINLATWLRLGLVFASESVKEDVERLQLDGVSNLGSVWLQVYPEYVLTCSRT